MKNKKLRAFLSIHRHSYKHPMHLTDIAGKVKDQRRKSKVFLNKPSFLKRIRRSIVARINIRFWKPMIPFGGINPKSRIYLRFRSGASTRSLVSSAIPFGSINPESHIFCDSVREHQPGVSYFLFLRFHLKNVTIFRIKFDFRRKYTKKGKRKEFVFSSPGQNVRLLSLPYSWFSAMRKEGQL